MVNQCFLCKKMDYKHPYLSFHRVTNETKRKVWNEVLQLKSALPLNAALCSDHFNAEDITVKPSGRHVLRANALPLPPHSDNTIVSKTDEPIASTSALKRKRSDNETSESECEMQQIEIDCDRTDSGRPSAVGYEHNSPKVQAVDAFTATTSTASETEEHLMRMMESGELAEAPDAVGNSPFRGKLALIEKKKPTYVIRKPAEVVVERQKRKIKSLHQSLRRLKRKVNSLESLVDVLKEKAMITTENAEASIVRQFTAKVINGSTREEVLRMLRTTWTPPDGCRRRTVRKDYHFPPARPLRMLDEPSMEVLDLLEDVPDTLLTSTAYHRQQRQSNLGSGGHSHHHTSPSHRAAPLVHRTASHSSTASQTPSQHILSCQRFLDGFPLV